MNRLTRESCETYYPNKKVSFAQMGNKLGKLEDLEQELGCPLEVVFKALKEGITFKMKVISSSTEDNFKTETVEERQYESIGIISLGYDGNKYLFVVPYDVGRTSYKRMIVRLENYRKTWWLKGEKDAKKEN